jgi:hypothetical protein
MPQIEVRRRDAGSGGDSNGSTSVGVFIGSGPWRSASSNGRPDWRSFVKMLDIKPGARDDMEIRYILWNIANVAQKFAAEKREYDRRRGYDA